MSKRRFWDDVGFCMTLFWALRRNPNSRVGQLIDNALFHANKSLRKDHDSLYNVEDEELSTYLEEYTNWINQE